jgi:hypothetical protein
VNLETLIPLPVAPIAVVLWFVWPRAVRALWPRSEALRRNMGLPQEQVILLGRLCYATMACAGVLVFLLALLFPEASRP